MELCKIIIRRIWLISTCMNVMHANPHTICKTNTHTRAHTLVWATMSSASSPPWIKHLTSRAAGATRAHVLVFVTVAMPVLPPVACYPSERVKPSGRPGCGDSPVATTACSRGVSRWVIAARHSGRDSTSSSVPFTSPPWSPTINLLHVPPLRSPEPSNNHWAAAISLEVLFAVFLRQPSLPISCYQAIVLFYFCPILFLLLLFLTIPPLPKSISRSESVDWE